MNKLNKEQLQSIVDNAPDGATGYAGVFDYTYSQNYSVIVKGREQEGWLYPILRFQSRSLSDIKTIIEQQEEIERLKDALTSLYGDAFYDGFIAARDFEIKENHQSVADVNDDDVLAWSEHAEAEYLLRLKEQKTNG